MITGFDVGTQVKWNDENTLTTGVIRKVFYQPETVEVDGQTFRVEVSDHSPTYLVQHHTGELLILPHQAVFLKDMNAHT